MNGVTFLFAMVGLMVLYLAYHGYKIYREITDPPPPEVQKLLDEYKEWKKKNK